MYMLCYIYMRICICTVENANSFFHFQNQRSAVSIPCAVSERSSDGRVAAQPTYVSFPIRPIGMLNWRVSRGRTSRCGIPRVVPRRLAAGALASFSLTPATEKGKRRLSYVLIIYISIPEIKFEITASI